MSFISFLPITTFQTDVIDDAITVALIRKLLDGLVDETLPKLVANASSMANEV